MNRKIFLISILALVVDQATKILIGLFFALDEKWVVIPHFFSLHFIENNGAAWSILASKVDFLILASLLAIFIIYRFMYHFKLNKRNTLAFGLILGGIVGNLMDRVFLGYVRDFLSFRFWNYQYPIFNFADTFIVIGVLLLIIAIVKGEDEHERIDSKRK